MYTEEPPRSWRQISQDYDRRAWWRVGQFGGLLLHFYLGPFRSSLCERRRAFSGIAGKDIGGEGGL
jgi:hypothetical protein